tara:strand:+ start:945 stop:1457 length:513 start_codon:yes stop_codon:yes gene_type:complete
MNNENKTKQKENSDDQNHFEQLEDLKKEYEKLENITARAQADLVNLRNRIQNEQLEIRNRAELRIILKFIDVINQFESAIKSKDKKTSPDPWIEGVEVIYRNFEHLLSNEGFIRIETIGKPFDPRLHEAILNTPIDHVENGIILNEFSPGYIRDEIVVKPATVEIAASND